MSGGLAFLFSLFGLGSIGLKTSYDKVRLKACELQRAKYESEVQRMIKTIGADKSEEKSVSCYVTCHPYDARREVKEALIDIFGENYTIPERPDNNPLKQIDYDYGNIRLDEKPLKYDVHDVHNGYSTSYWLVQLILAKRGKVTEEAIREGYVRISTEEMYPINTKFCQWIEKYLEAATGRSYQLVGMIGAGTNVGYSERFRNQMMFKQIADCDPVRIPTRREW